MTIEEELGIITERVDAIDDLMEDKFEIGYANMKTIMRAALDDQNKKIDLLKKVIRKLLIKFSFEHDEAIHRDFFIKLEKSMKEGEPYIQIKRCEPQTIEEAYKSCKYLENICKESLSPNEECNKECEEKLKRLKEDLINKKRICIEVCGGKMTHTECLYCQPLKIEKEQEDPYIKCSIQNKEASFCIECLAKISYKKHLKRCEEQEVNEINDLFEDDYGKCPKCKTEKLTAIWEDEEHAPGAVEYWIAGLKCPKCGYIDFGEVKIEEVEPLKKIEIEFLKKHGWYQQIKKEQEQKDITEFIESLKKIPTGNRETHLAIVELIEKLEGKNK